MIEALKLRRDKCHVAISFVALVARSARTPVSYPHHNRLARTRPVLSPCHSSQRRSSAEPEINNSSIKSWILLVRLSKACQRAVTSSDKPRLRIACIGTARLDI